MAQESIITASKAESRKRHGGFAPGEEGISWEKCKICGRPIRDKFSRARKMGLLCFKRQQAQKNAANVARNQADLQKQLDLFKPLPYDYSSAQSP